MPFVNIKTESPKRTFQVIDDVVNTSVLPEVRWHEFGRIVPLLPNGHPDLFLDDAGAMEEKNPQDYFVLLCLKKGLSYSEIELWLDTCLQKGIVKGNDGKERLIIAEQESALRFDEQKPIYQFNGIYRRYLVIRE